MLCSNCAKLARLYTKKFCMRCQGEVLINISVLCEFCSSTEKMCSVCLKKIVPPTSHVNKGCNCGKK